MAGFQAEESEREFGQSSGPWHWQFPGGGVGTGQPGTVQPTGGEQYPNASHPKCLAIPFIVQYFRPGPIVHLVKSSSLYREYCATWDSAN